MEFDWETRFSCNQIYWISFIESRKSMKRTWAWKAWNWNKRFRDIFYIRARSYKKSCTADKFDIFDHCFNCSFFWVLNTWAFDEDFECWETFDLFRASYFFRLCDINCSYYSIDSLSLDFGCNFIIILYKLNTMATTRRIKFNKYNIVLRDNFFEGRWSKLDYILITKFQSAFSHAINTWLDLLFKSILVELVKILS